MERLHDFACMYQLYEESGMFNVIRANLVCTIYLLFLFLLPCTHTAAEVIFETGIRGKAPKAQSKMSLHAVDRHPQSVVLFV